MIHTEDDYREFTSYPIDLKVSLTKNRIRFFVKNFGSDNVVIIATDDKSDVLKHLVHSVDNDVKIVYNDNVSCDAQITSWQIKTEEDKNSWYEYGCCAYDMDMPTCRPLSFWNDVDIDKYRLRFMGVDKEN
jgi:hypothetical protein